MSADNNTTLLVRRPRQWGDRLRAYAVEVDGQKIGEIRAGGEETFLLAAGPHRLRCAIDWCGSNTLEVHAEPGGIVAFEIRTKITGWRMFLALYYIVFARDRYLTLARLPAGTLPAKPMPVLPVARIH